MAAAGVAETDMEAWRLCAREDATEVDVEPANVSRPACELIEVRRLVCVELVRERVSLKTKSPASLASASSSAPSPARKPTEMLLDLLRCFSFCPACAPSSPSSSSASSSAPSTMSSEVAEGSDDDSAARLPRWLLWP